MSFVQGGITFYEPGDLPLITTMGAGEGMLVYSGNGVKKIAKANFYTGNLPSQISLAGTGYASISASYGFICELIGTKPVIFSHFSGENRFYLYNSFLELRLNRTDSIVRAGSFIQWSGQKDKTNIREFEKDDLSKITPRRYTDTGGRSRIGFVAEDLPSDYVSEALDEEQKPNIWRKGIDLMAMIASLWKSVQELARRVDVLEKKT